MLTANIGFGPMSTEIIEAVFRYSNYHRAELMLIASKNQIDYAGGYVNSWTTADFKEFIKKMKKEYQFSNVKICRDHCGPGFNDNYDLEDTYKTIETDIANDFDLMHIDFCHFQGSNRERLRESEKAIKYCLKLKPEILIEIGTDENVGSNFTLNSLGELEEEIDFFKSFCDPEFYVVQTGSLVKEINQVGSFNSDFIKRAAKIIHEKNLKLKEHNADYLSKDEILKRKDIIDAINIAPQLGVIQTNLVLNKCLVFGVRFDDFLEKVCRGNRWKKWMHKNKPANKFLCSLIAGHYHFASEEYGEIVSQLNKYEDIRESIINITMEVIDHYESSQ